MPNLDKANNIQATIRRLIDMPASGLIRVPEIENDSPEDAIRKLQIQVFELSDALAELTDYVKRIPQPPASVLRRNYP